MTQKFVEEQARKLSQRIKDWCSEHQARPRSGIAISSTFVEEQARKLSQRIKLYAAGYMKAKESER